MCLVMLFRQLLVSPGLVICMLKEAVSDLLPLVDLVSSRDASQGCRILPTRFVANGHFNNMLMVMVSGLLVFWDVVLPLRVLQSY